MPVVPAMQEAEMGGSQHLRSAQAKVNEIQSQKANWCSDSQL
jgi:hypothetical protein